MIAGSSDPLFDDWSATNRDPNRVVAANVKLVAARASSLVEDWPVAAAMVRARLLGTHGSKGLRYTSLFQRDDDPDTDDAERTTRREIEAVIRRRGSKIDASGMTTRRRWDRDIDQMAIVLGNGWAVRVNQGDQHRWRIVHPFRIRNPAGTCNSERMQDGVELDANFRPLAVHVDPSRQTDLTIPSSSTIRIPWTAPDGTPNVIHRVGWRIPGGIHGLSFFAPIMLPARMLQGISDAYVAAKRVQASIPLLMTVEDIAKAKEAYRGTRLANLVMPQGSEVEFPSWSFQGEDYQAFTDTEIRNVCAAWGIPWELVLGDHSAKSGASSRSLWQQFYQQAEDWQADFADEVSRPVDESCVREAAIAGEVTGLTDDWERNMVGAYKGPPRVMPDPLKEAQAAREWDGLGRSKTSAFAEQGWDYREETLAKGQEQANTEEQDQAEEQSDEEPAPEPTQEQAPSSAPDSDEENPAEPADEEDQQESKPSAAALREDIRAYQIALAAASAPRTEIHLAANMPLAAAPTVVNNVAASPATVTIQPAVAAVHNHVAPAPVTVQAASPVTVNVPQQPAPVVMATASAAPIHVHVPEQKQRKMRAVEQRDGSVIMEEIGD